MDAWVWWVIAAAVLAGVEVLTLDLIFIMLAGGSLAAAGVAGADGHISLQVAVAIVVAVAGLGLLRPVAMRHLRTTPEIRTGVDALVGQEALVLSEVGPHEGRVKLAGEVWSARSYDGASTYAAGQTIAVLKIEGATALVG
ncbi:NfeD family protein [Sporichthya brevicatena]|uniref:NfeD family protein n=1 Tax=Sporichthya brevicatena TaxID=171442 RepID=A0ABP3S1M2_9ACTN